MRVGSSPARRLRRPVGAAAPLPGGGELTLSRLDEALFPVEAVNDFSAIYEAGDPATLELSIASPPALRLPASLKRFMRASQRTR